MPSFSGRGRPMRHKDLGIWQTWTWARGARRRARLRGRACTDSASSAATPSPSSAPTGRGSTGRSWRRRCSAPFRCRSMPTRSPTSWPMCSPTPTCASPRSRTRSRSTRSCRCRSGCRSCEQIVYDEPRGLRDYDHSRLHAIDDVIADGRKALAERSGSARRGSTARSRPARARDPSIILYTSGTTGALQGRGAVRRAAAINAASDTVAFDKLTEHDVALAYLPLAWVGDHYLNYAQGAGRRLLHGLPGKRRDRDGRICARSARPSSSRRRACSRSC